MTYYVNLPNGNRIPFEDDVPEDVAKYRALHNYFSPPAAPTELPSEAPSAPAAGGGLGDWFPVTSALHRTGAELASAAEGVGRMTGLKGLEEYARSVQESQSKAAEEALPESRRVRFENISGPVSAAQFGTQAATESALPMAAAIAGGTYGASLGSAFGPPGALVGGLGGAIIGGGLAMLPTTYGSMRESQIAQAQRAREAQGLPTPKREEIEVNEGAALAAAVPVAIAQAAANRITFGLGRSVGLSMEEVGTTLLPRIARGAGVGAVDQIPVGVLQTALDRAQTGRDLFSEDALEEYKKMTAESAAIGAMFGGAHRGLFGKRPGPRESGFDPDLRRAITEDLAERNRIRGENFPDFIDTPVGRMPFSAADDFFTKRYPGLGDIPETERRVNAGNIIFTDEVTVNSNNIKASEAEISGYNDIIKQNTDAKNDLIKKSKSPKGTRVSKDVLDFYDAKIKDAQDAIKDAEDRIRQLKKATPELPQSLRKAVDAPEPFFKPEMIQGALDALDQRTKPPEAPTAPPEVPPPVEPTVKAGAAPEAPTPPEATPKTPEAAPEATTVPPNTRASFNNTPEGQALLAEAISARQSNDPAREAAAMERYSKALAEFERGEIGEAARQPREWSAESEFSGRAEEPAKAAEETKPEAPKEEPPKATPQDESAAAKARKIIDDHLKKISDTGKQGENIAAGLREMMDMEGITPAQAYAAFKVGEILNRILPAGADHVVQFLRSISTSGAGEAALRASGALGKSTLAGERVPPQIRGDQIERGIISLSLEPNKIGIMRDTAAHEAFHVIQDYLAKYDPKLAKMLSADFRDGMTINDIDKTLRRKLQLAKNEKGITFWDSLKNDLKDSKISAREAQAYTFAALSDAYSRGTPMTGIKPAYTRLVNNISQFFQRLGNSIRGDGFQTVGDVFERINKGEAARRFANLEAPGRVAETKWEGEAPRPFKGYSEAEFSARGSDVLNKEQSNILSKISSTKLRLRAKDTSPLSSEDRTLTNNFQENLNRNASGVEFSARGSDDIVNYRMANWEHVEFPSDWGVGKDGMAFYYKGSFAHGGRLDVDAYVSTAHPDTIYVGTVATSGLERNPFSAKSRTQIKDQEIENRVNVGARQTLQALEKMTKDIASVFPDVKKVEFVRGTGARGIFPEGKEGVIPLPSRWLPEKPWSGEAERLTKPFTGEAEFSARQGEEYAARTAAPAVPGASFVEKVQGIDPIKQSVFGRALAAFTGAKKLTYIYGEPSAEKNWDALVRSSVNLAHPFYIYDDLLRSQGIWNGRNAGRAVEEAFVHGGRIQNLLEDGMLQIDPRTKEVSIVPGSEPLLKIIGNDVSASDIKEQRDFGAYLIGLRERDLRADGRQGFHNVTDVEIANHIREMEAAHPEWRGVADKLQNFNKGLLKFATESGVIDRAQAAHLESMFYTPFYRLMESDVNAAPERALGPRMQNALQDPRSWMRELKGGESAVGDVFKNIILNADSIIKSGMKNMAMKTATEIMEIGGVARKVPEGVSFGRNENVVSFRVDGKNVQYHVADPVLWAAIGGMPATQRGALANVAAKFAHFFRESVTMAPSFMLSNIWRGKIIAYAQEGAPLIRGTAASLKDAFQHGASSQAIAAGSGFGGYTWGMGERDIAKNFARRLRMQSGEGTISDRIMTALKGMQRLSESTEMMERVNIYNAAIKQGMSHGDAAWKAYQLAPFSRRGTGDGFFGSMVRSALPYIPFLNARLQGLYRLVEANPGSARVLGIPKEIFLRSLMVMAFSTAAAGYAMVNDPDGWAGLTVDQKMNYHNIPIGDGKMIGIPREFEVGTFFGGLPVMMMDQLFRQGAAGKDMAKALGAAISTTFGFTPIPTIAQPLISTIANYDFFRQAPLENKQQQQLPVAERRNLRTTETAKAISAGATALGSYVKELPIIGSLSALSPIKAQALLEGYLGTLGTIALTGFDQTMSYMGVTPKKPIAGVGDPNSPAGIAATMLGMGRFIKTDLERANYWMQNYSEMKHDIDTVVRSMTTARQMNDVEALKKYTEQDKKMYSIHNQINTISQNMSKINRQINIINNDQNMSPQEKYNKIEELHKSQADMARRVVEYGRKLGIM